MIDQDRMMRFRSELHGLGDLDRVSGTQMLFAFQRFAAIVLDGETAEVAEPLTSSDDVPHDEPAVTDQQTEATDATPEPETPAVADEAPAVDQGVGEDGVPGSPESDPAQPEEPVPATEAQPDPLTEAAP